MHYAGNRYTDKSANAMHQAPIGFDDPAVGQTTAVHIDRLPKRARSLVGLNVKREFLGPTPHPRRAVQRRTDDQSSPLPNMQLHQWATPYGLGFSPNTRRNGYCFE